MHVGWDAGAAATPHGQLIFFAEFLAEFLAATGVFERWVSACPLAYKSGNAPTKRDVLGTLMLGLLAGHRRYAHSTALRGDAATRRRGGRAGAGHEQGGQRRRTAPGARTHRRADEPTSPSSPPRASPTCRLLEPGQLSSCVGTTMSTGTAASATSPLASVIAAQFRPSWRLDTISTSTPESATARAGPAPRATGPQSAQSPSTRSATRSSRTTRKQNLNNRWLHKQGNNYLDARRLSPAHHCAGVG